MYDVLLCLPPSHWIELAHPFLPLADERTVREVNNYLVKCRVDNETVVFVPINGAKRRALHNAGQLDLKLTR